MENNKLKHKKKTYLPPHQAGLLLDKYGNVAYFSMVAAIILCNICLYYKDYLETREFDFGTKIIVYNFKNFDLAIMAWIGFYSTSLVVVSIFNVLLFWWRSTICLKEKQLPFPLKVFITGMVLTYYIVWFYAIHYVVFRFNLHCATGIAFTGDTIRLLMKQHSYFYENLYFLNIKDGESSSLFLENYIYFSFIPTLIYKKTFKRSQARNWKLISRSCFEIFLAILVMAMALDKLMLSDYSNYGLHKVSYSPTSALIMFLKGLITGTCLIWGLFVSVLHSTQNGMAELTGYTVNDIYSDWWNSSSLTKYLRTWNIVVQDWLFKYIYTESKPFFKTGTTSAVLVLTVSALGHEFIASNSIQLHFPYCFILMCFSCILFKIIGVLDYEVGKGWPAASTYLGGCILSAVYLMEYFARKNCPIQNETFGSHFYPWSFINNCI